MNQIPVNQNSQKQLERLAAQRELYSSSKRLHVFQILITVIIPIILAIVSGLIQEFAPFAAIYGIGVFVLDISFIDPLISRKKTKAAKIQELFDCDVLEIPKSPLKTVDDITVEEVLTHYNAHIKVKTNVEKIKNWYSPSVGKLSIRTARILCQRTNCWWDSKLRNRYSDFLKYISIIVFLLLLFYSLIINMAILNFILILSTLVPFFQFCIKQANENKEAANRSKELVLYSVQIWNNALKNTCNDQTMIVDSRRLQDEIFEHRKKSPLILNFFYKIFRDKDEELMNRTNEILIQEAIENNCP
ncbi:MAG: S-4TM family putative pore-forming effector [Aequorivita antarctica]